jgi:opacity protein-like surface antigen
MKARFLLAAVAAACPLHAACAQGDEPAASVRDPLGSAGFRAELLGGSDDDGFDSGVLYGGRIGYDFRVSDRFLLGVDGEVNDVTTDRTLTISTQPSLRAKDGPALYVGGRATLVLSHRFSLYGSAGYTRMRQGFFIQTDPNPPPFGTIGVGHFTFEGYRVGAGVQFSLGKHAFLGAEARYSHYGEFGTNRGQVVGSLGFRF